MLLLLACSGTPDVDSSDSDVATDDTEVEDTSTDDTEDTGHLFECGVVDAPVDVEDIPALDVVGEVTWTLDFDETAEGNGYGDCSYTRTYVGTQVLDRPWLCDGCSVQAEGEATIIDGEDCLALISSSGTVRTEMWGWDEDEGFYRAGHEHGRMGQLTGPVDNSFDYDAGEAELTWEGDLTLSDDRGTGLLTASGTMTWAPGETLIAELWAAERAAPYSGGWPQNDPGTLENDWGPAIGETLPNFRLQDQCLDRLDLWDLHGSYTIVEVSQYNCGPCQVMAETAGEFQSDMAAEGIDVQFVTLHGNGLSDSYSSPPESIINDWTAAFGNHGPVIYDRGYGIAMAYSLIEDYSLSFPAWFIVDENFTVIHAQTGFGDWSTAEAIITAE
jgi:hypothetical protein